jgi:hypothetical protein
VATSTAQSSHDQHPSERRSAWRSCSARSDQDSRVCQMEPGLGERNPYRSAPDANSFLLLAHGVSIRPARALNHIPASLAGCTVCRPGTKILPTSVRNLFDPVHQLQCSLRRLRIYYGASFLDLPIRRNCDIRRLYCRDCCSGALKGITPRTPLSPRRLITLERQAPDVLDMRIANGNFR